MTIGMHTSSADAWEAEYNNEGIPSSARAEPSNVVRDFLSHLDRDEVRPTTAIDIGCGSGRNSLYLAQQGLDVFALDFAASQIASLQQKAAEIGLGKKINGVVHDIATPWPISNELIDVAIDTYCFKHQIHLDAVQNYINEIRRVMRSKGDFLLFLADKTDGYYAKFEIESQDGIGTIISDPGNNILSRLYDRKEIEDLFVGFSVARYYVKMARNEMHGRMYDRVSHVWHMRRD